MTTLLAAPADTHLLTNLSGTSRRGGVACWPESVQYLTLTYATLSAMREILDDPRTIKQQQNELEKSYRNRFSNAIHRCGKCHGKYGKITRYIDGLSAMTRKIVASHLEIVSCRDMTFKDIIHFARYEDKALSPRAWQNPSTRSYYNIRTVSSTSQKRCIILASPSYAIQALTWLFKPTRRTW